MLEINHSIRIPEEELSFTFVRAGGPGGQNVNKVASKAVLRWNLDASPSVPDAVKARLRVQQRRRITLTGDLVLTSQKFRDQEKNRRDCLEKLRSLVLQATYVPKVRRKTKPTRGSHERRLAEKRHRARTKSGRRAGGDD
jgi:ribosome-associated protein